MEWKLWMDVLNWIETQTPEMVWLCCCNNTGSYTDLSSPLNPARSPIVTATLFRLSPTREGPTHLICSNTFSWNSWVFEVRFWASGQLSLLAKAMNGKYGKSRDVCRQLWLHATINCPFSLLPTTHRALGGLQATNYFRGALASKRVSKSKQVPTIQYTYDRCHFHFLLFGLWSSSYYLYNVNLSRTHSRREPMARAFRLLQRHGSPKSTPHWKPNCSIKMAYGWMVENRIIGKTFSNQRVFLGNGNPKNNRIIRVDFKLHIHIRL